MRLCTKCGEQNSDRARFCQGCGAPLAVAGGPEEERKIISVVFVDLIGFTQQSDGADPEDVRAMLRPYFSLLKQEIEGFGGTVEKFIGDAVVGVFGAPVAHEDDPERAVRAALRISEAIEKLNDQMPGIELRTRAAVNTGEAVVVYEAGRDAGTGMVTGDVVNTASRLQQIAPEGGVVVGELTYRATKDVIDYEELAPVLVKGKAEPILVWRALSPRARSGIDIAQAVATPFIGRDHELMVLKTAYFRSLRESCIQLVTITGEPGVGKSRLVSEFAQFVDEQPELVNWRHGRCLPYGKGITFWALSEIVKAQAGILDSDTAEQVAEKLDASIRAILPDTADGDWLRSALAPLVGATSDHDATFDQTEAFTAWRRFLEAIASTRPLVLVFEDLHWGDDALLAFIEHLVDWSSDVPLFVVCTARPELYTKSRGWGGGKRNSNTVALSPLTTEDTARLVSALLSSVVLPSNTQSDLLERAGGIPLYAEQFVRMLVDRGFAPGPAGAEEAAEIAVPDSVHALIAARLDTLSPELKSLLQDASVVGKTFWSGALAAMQSVDEATIIDRLHELSHKEFVRHTKTSSFKNEIEYSFRHVLIRDVAYSRIARRARFRKHWAAATWTEDAAKDRIGDYAEVLADHYAVALELARSAAADSDTLATLETKARRFLVLAGDRALHLHAPNAASYYRRALELFSPGDPERGGVLIKAGEANEDAGGSLSDSQRDFEEALAEFTASGDSLAVGRVTVTLAHNLDLQGETGRAEELFERAVQLLEREPPGKDLVIAYAHRAGRSMLAGRPLETVELCNKALEALAGLDLPEDRALLLNYRGSARCELGDLEGLADMRESVAMSAELSPQRRTVFTTNLADWLWLMEGPDQGLTLLDEVVDISAKFGLGRSALWAEAERLWMLFELGRWDELGTSADKVLERTAPGSQLWAVALPYKARLLATRGEIAGAGSLVDIYLERAREIGDPQVVVPALIVGAITRHAQGRVAEALGLVTEFGEVTNATPIYRVQELAEAVRLAAPLEASTAHRLIEGLDHPAARARNSIVTAQAVLHEVRGDYGGAARLYDQAVGCWRAYGHKLEEGQARLGEARCLLQLGQQEAAVGRLTHARQLFTELGAWPLVERVEDLAVVAVGS